SLFFIWDPTKRLHLFSELDVVEQDEPSAPRRTFQTERLYGDLAALDWLNLRVGKFLTPVGRWNLIHARPLVWTTSRPLVTELPFDRFTTGAMLFGSRFPGTGTLTYSLYGQFTDQFDAEPEPQAELVRELPRSEEHTSELQSPDHLVCRLLLEKKKHIEESP